MSFLSRRPSRSGSRDGDAGRDDEYGDYDYAPDGYGGDEDENWSPGEYFSPDGIKGRRAGGQGSSERPDAQGRRGAAAAARGDAGRGDARGDSGQGYQDRPDDGYNSHGPGGGYGYGADEYATGAYELPEGSDEEPAERGGRRRKDRGDWTGIFSLRRDRGEEIWPDDGVSDEDYWASVASDQPLTGANPPPGSQPRAADSRPMGRPGGQAGSDGGARMPATGDDDVRAGAGARLGAAPRSGGDQRFGDEPRGVTGRLGPPPGLRGDYQPGGGPTSARPGTGPQAARPGTGPMAARPGTGPQARPARTAGVGPIGAWSSQAGFAQSRTGQASYQPSGPQASYQPSGPQASYQPGGLAGRTQDSRETDSRQADRGADWGDRTERIERVNASGYPEPRGNSRGQGPGRPGPSRTSGPLGAPVAVGRGGARGDGGWGSVDGAGHRAPDHRAPGRDADRDSARNSGGWPISARGGATADRVGDDDPLTSRAYSRAAVSDADGRSYRVAARRSQAQAKLTEQATATFTAAGSYPSEGYRAGLYETGATEAYRPASTRPARPASTPPSSARPRRPTGIGPGSTRPASTASTRPTRRRQPRATRATAASPGSPPSRVQRAASARHPSRPGAATQAQPAQPGKQAQDQPVSAGQPVRAARTAPAGSVGRADPTGRTERARRAGQAVRSQSATRAGSACPPELPRTPGRTQRRRHRRHSSPGSRSSARTPSHLATATRRNSRPGAAGVPSAAGARRAARRPGPRRLPPGRTRTSQRSRVPIRIRASLTHPLRLPRRPTPARQRPTPPWTHATGATHAMTETAGTTGPDSRRPMATVRPAWTTGLPATAPLATDATDGRY